MDANIFVKDESGAFDVIGTQILRALYCPNWIVFYSWGCHDFKPITYNELPALKFKTNGFQHKGNVVVTFNEGNNLYDIYILNRMGNVKHSEVDVPSEKLQSVVDCLVETKDDQSDDYKNRIHQEKLKNNRR